MTLTERRGLATTGPDRDRQFGRINRGLRGSFFPDGDHRPIRAPHTLEPPVP
ncbi:MAG: hypothetical protein ACRDTT_27135 [Pseudonocardiaceae bacterium]